MSIESKEHKAELGCLSAMFLMSLMAFLIWVYGVIVHLDHRINEAAIRIDLLEKRGNK